MKYLKEGKWEDFSKDYEQGIEKHKEFLIELNKSLLSEINVCMVDLEDYQINYNEFHLTYDNVCVYSHKIKKSNINKVEDTIIKINSYLGEDSYSFQWVTTDIDKEVFSRKVLHNDIKSLIDYDCNDDCIFTITFYFKNIINNIRSSYLSRH